MRLYSRADFNGVVWGGFLVDRTFNVELATFNVQRGEVYESRSGGRERIELDRHAIAQRRRLAADDSAIGTPGSLAAFGWE